MIKNLESRELRTGGLAVFRPDPHGLPPGDMLLLLTLDGLIAEGRNSGPNFHKTLSGHGMEITIKRVTDPKDAE